MIMERRGNAGTSLEKRFIVAGGGTGGHIFPAIAIANAIKKISPDAVFLFVGAKGKMEMEKVPQAGFAIEGLSIAGYNRSSLIKNVGLPFKLVKSFFQVSRVFKKFKPHAVIGVGGYSSFPVLRFAQSKNIPTFIHESNSFAGKSNILLGKKATKIFTATKGMEIFFPAEKIVISGNPVRDSIKKTDLSKQEALQYFGLTEGRTTLLSLGGSLGAASINKAIQKDIDLLEKNGIQLIWQTGKLFIQEAKNCVRDKKNIYVSDFISNMESAYAAADIVISRSGAMTVAELCLAEKAVVFVPYPFAAENHQKVNAQQLVNENAAWMVEDGKVNEELIPAIVKLSLDKDQQHLLKENIKKMGIANADEVIADEILKCLN